MRTQSNQPKGTYKSGSSTSRNPNSSNGMGVGKTYWMPNKKSAYKKKKNKYSDLIWVAVLLGVLFYIPDMDSKGLGGVMTGLQKSIGLDSIQFHRLVICIEVFIGLIVAALIARKCYMWSYNRQQRAQYRNMLLEFKWSEGLTPREFEVRCADYLSFKGWKAKVGSGSADQGVDVTAQKGKLKVAIQCKLYSKPVGNKAVQEIFAGMQHRGCNRAVVVSNQIYTKAAQELAKATKVQLLHFTDLANLENIVK